MNGSEHVLHSDAPLSGTQWERGSGGGHCVAAVEAVEAAVAVVRDSRRGGVDDGVDDRVDDRERDMAGGSEEGW